MVMQMKMVFLILMKMVMMFQMKKMNHWISVVKQVRKH